MAGAADGGWFSWTWLTLYGCESLGRTWPGCDRSGHSPTIRNQTSETLQANQTDAAINPGNSGGADVLSSPGRTGPRGHIAEADGPKPALLRNRTALASRGGRC